jgi:hypothetical protein
MEQRNLYLNTLKHLDFQLVEDLSDAEIEKNKKLQQVTVDQLKKIEQELAHLLSKKT